MGFSDLLGTFSDVALGGPAPTASGGGLWDTIKGTVGQAWDWAKDLGAAVIERKILGAPPAPAPAPAPGPMQPLIMGWPAPGAGATRIDWGMGGEVTTQAPLVAIPGLGGMAPLLLVGAAVFLMMKGGK